MRINLTNIKHINYILYFVARLRLVVITRERKRERTRVYIYC